MKTTSDRGEQDYFRELNVTCLDYLLGRLSKAEEKTLKEKLNNDRAYRNWFNWLLLKWLKMKWLKKQMSSKTYKNTPKQTWTKPYLN